MELLESSKTSIGPVAGRFAKGTISSPFLPAGTIIKAQVRTWLTSAGSFEDAILKGAEVGYSSVFEYRTGDPSNHLAPPTLMASGFVGLGTSPAKFTFLRVSSPTVTNLIGSSVTLSASFENGQAEGYQWYFNCCPLVDNERIQGSRSTVLTINQFSSDDVGMYWATATNTFPKFVQVSNPVRIFGRLGTELKFKLLAHRDIYTKIRMELSPFSHTWQMQFEASTDLVHWEKVDVVWNVLNFYEPFVTNSNTPWRFWRVKVLNP